MRIITTPQNWKSTESQAMGRIMRLGPKAGLFASVWLTLSWSVLVFADPPNAGPYNTRCCTVNTVTWGYYETQWRQWPCGQKPEEHFPASVGAQPIPTPPGQEQIPLPKATLLPSKPEPTKENLATPAEPEGKPFNPVLPEGILPLVPSNRQPEKTLPGLEPTPLPPRTPAEPKEPSAPKEPKAPKLESPVLEGVLPGLPLDTSLGPAAPIPGPVAPLPSSIKGNDLIPAPPSSPASKKEDSRPADRRRRNRPLRTPRRMATNGVLCFNP